MWREIFRGGTLDGRKKGGEAHRPSLVGFVVTSLRPILGRLSMQLRRGDSRATRTSGGHDRFMGTFITLVACANRNRDPEPAATVRRYTPVLLLKVTTVYSDLNYLYPDTRFLFLPCSNTAWTLATHRGINTTFDNFANATCVQTIWRLQGCRFPH